jgi:hypothetical protein
MLKLKTDVEEYPGLLDWLRYFCAFMLYMYGISKLLHLQFNMQSQLNVLLSVWCGSLPSSPVQYRR